ncbi:enoyl-CoA hydratase FadB (plasmid) [Cupriavidus necator N-1]|uniref:Enoyl-CoA hydratase FadB n=1 Tax=Cupriavidus necator (strain ATCC 43291 / DSM 13513 / CCUG 52238 / LMG 8453 / N-1) TaxID=1042878 RepID=F8GX79_CUPNN|nr:enoyl-CoA hydratase-related protein [Cupriavidus necator]AEI81949.1 enoyl-CoA hydratase FadB [Cupriavidus necator N-1]MDX6008270.1 enoyl-CoA hydratase-related protein [Cupriavidus necator]
MPQPALLEKHGDVATIVLNRPEHANAIDPDSTRALIQCIDAVAAEPSARVVVLRATGRMFCAGGSIDFFAKGGADFPAVLDELLGPLHAALHKLATLPVPVISAVNGPVVGGGIGLALCADIALAAESMKLRGGYSAIGLTPDACSSWFLTRRVGPMRAKQIFFTNDSLSAQQCLAMGIVSEVVPDAELAARTTALAEALARGATGALGRIKQLVDGAHERSLEAQLDLEHRLMVESAASAEAREGIAAFLSKRVPRFS